MSITNAPQLLVDAQDCNQSVLVLIVARLTITGAGLVTLLSYDPNIHVVGVAGNRLQLQALLAHKPIHVVLVCADTELELTIPDVVNLTKAHHPTSKVLLLCTGYELAGIRDLITAGIDGCLTMELDQKALIKAVHDVQYYGFVLAADIVGARRTVIPQSQQSLLAILSKREQDVLKALGQGQSNLQIAKSLCISCDTVRTHLRHLYCKLGVYDRSALVTLASEISLILLVLLAASCTHPSALL